MNGIYLFEPKPSIMIFLFRIKKSIITISNKPHRLLKTLLIINPETFKSL